MIHLPKCVSAHVSPFVCVSSPRLLSVPRLADGGDDLIDMFESRDGDDWSELLLMEESHLRRDSIYDRWLHELAHELTAGTQLCALRDGIADHRLEDLWLLGLGKRRDGHILLPRQAHLERAHLVDELLDEGVGDRRVHHDELDGGAPLPVV